MASLRARRDRVRSAARAPHAVLALALAALLVRSWQVDGPVLVVPALGALAVWAGTEHASRRRGSRTLARERELARTDHLTGAANRRALDEALAEASARARRGGPPAALVVFDVDRFKEINLRHGWDGGDAVLRALVTRVGETLRRSDLLARRGGEEFAVVAHAVADAEALRRTAAKVHGIVRAAAFPAGDGYRVRVTVSVGAALLDGSADPREVERRANLALAAAKARRDRAVVWSDAVGAPPLGQVA